MNGADLLDRALAVAVVALACLLAFKVFADDGGKVVRAVPGVERPWLPGERERVLGTPPAPGEELSRPEEQSAPRLRFHLEPGEVIDCRRIDVHVVQCRAVRGFWL